MLSRCRPLLGTFVEITADAEDAIDLAFAAVECVHDLMSAHKPDSDVSRINRHAHLEPVTVHGLTAAVIERALFWSRASDGAFDVVFAGNRAVHGGYLPRHADQPPPLAAEWTELALDEDGVRLARQGAIDLGGIAKGAAVDEAIRALRTAGAVAGLVNAGGDLAGFGRSWPITIVEPLSRRTVATATVQNQALATTALQPDGTALHLPSRSQRYVSATMRAPNCIDADALAKVLMAGGPQSSRCLDLVGADGLLITAAGLVEEVERAAA